MTVTKWTRLIRFVNQGQIFYGEPIFSAGQNPDDVVALAESGVLRARTVENDIFSAQATVTENILQVEKLLGPLMRDQVPIIRCVGLNYMQHIKEGGRTPPPYPSIFIKPSTSLADFDEDVIFPKIAQATADYEGELTIVIGKATKDVTEEEATEYIAGYVCSNDVSCRHWQRDPKFAGNVPQWCFSKGFDKFAPIGPMIVSTQLLGAAHNLPLQTRVNGQLRQNSNTADLLFGVKRIVSFASQGTTLEAGTLIMTGTPAGVALGMKTPRYLKNDDVVEVSIQGLGKIKNRMVFA